MTGFGSATQEASGLRISAEIRSVNHRYFKLSARLPEELLWGQNTVETRVRGALSRGFVSVTVSVAGSTPGASSQIDQVQLKKLYEQVESVSKELGNSASICLTDFLGVPGIVIESGNRRIETPEVASMLESAIDGALSGLIGMQTREGGILHDELSGLVDAVSGGLDTIEARLVEINENCRERYLGRIKGFLEGTGVQVDHSDLIREVAILSEKADVAEEVGRLRGHLTQFREVLDEGGRVGRKLDFLTQEMFREANTMAAKVNLYELSREIVEIKANVDRLREQTQNVE